MANARKVEGFRLCPLHLVGQLQDVRKLLDHAERPQTRKDSGSEAEGFRLPRVLHPCAGVAYLLLDGDKSSQKREIKQALKLAAELGKE